jgi:hypothetical protein
MSRRGFASLLLWSAWLVLVPAQAQTTFSLPKPAPDCGSVVLLKCDKPQDADASKQDARRRLESRRIDSATLEFERIVIEGEGERQSPESTISRALSRPLISPGEQSFSIGESAQCTCLNVCPPPPFPCCSCTDRVGSRHATSPGWKPTN